MQKEVYPSSSNFLIAPPKGILAQYPIVKDRFWELVDQLPLMAPLPFRDIEEDENHKYMTLFDDKPRGEGVLDLPSIDSKMRVGKGEVP